MNDSYYSRFSTAVCLCFILLSILPFSTVAGINPAPGFPLPMEGVTGGCGALFCDLDGDGNDEVIVAGNNGKIYGFHIDGTPFIKPDGILVSLGDEAGILSPPAVYDLTGDGYPEIAVSADILYVVDINGNILLNLDVGGRSTAIPVITDIDEDGRPEIIGSGRNMTTPRTNFIYVYSTYYEGKQLKAELMPGFPIGNVAGSSPAVGDLDPGFPGLELAWGQRDGTVWAVHYDGTFMDGFPLRHGQRASNASPAIGDVDRDGKLEIVIGTSNDTLLVIGSDGQLKPGWPQQTGNLGISSPALADINGDGRFEIFVGSYEGDFYGLDSTGINLPGFPKKVGDSVYSSPIVSDIDNDNIPEVLVGSNDGKLYAWKTRTGESVDGFPLDFGEPVHSYPVVGTDGNGHTLLGISLSNEFHLYDLGPNTWNPDMHPWPMMKHDPQRTGNYHYTPTEQNEQESDITPPGWVDTAGIQEAFQVEDNTVRIYWNKAADTESEPVKYNLYVSEVIAHTIADQVIIDAVLPSERIADIAPVPSNFASGYDYEFEIAPAVAELKEGSIYRFEITAEDSAPEANETDAGAFRDVRMLDFMTISEINASLISDPSGIVGKEVITEIMGLSYNSSLFVEAIEAGQFIHDILTLKSLGDLAGTGSGLGGLDPTAFAKDWLKERTTYRAVAGTNPRETLDWHQVISPVNNEPENQIGKGWPVIAKVRVIEKSVFGENPRTLDIISFRHNWNRFDFLPDGPNQSEYQLYSFDHLNDSEINRNIVGVKGALIASIESRRKDGSNTILKLHNLRSTDETSKPVYVKIPFSDVKIPTVNSIIGAYGVVGVYQQYHCIETVREGISLIVGSEAPVSDDEARESANMAYVISAAESPVDLHIYDSIGNHTGAVYDQQGNVARIELGIPDSLYLGPDFHPELIAITDPGTGPYRQEVKGIEDGRYTLTTLAIDRNGGEVYRHQRKDEPIVRDETDVIGIPVIQNESGELISDGSLAVDPDIDKLAVEPVHVARQHLPEQTILLQNFPNPSNPETWIPYQLAEGADVTIHIYTVDGRLVRALNLGRRHRGYYTTRQKAAYWDGRNDLGEVAASGIYYYWIQAGDFSAVRKMILVE